jgi:hypothetical protein
MSDVAAGSNAALQLQQNMAAAPDVQQQQAMAVQQQQANLERTKLANLVASAGFESSKESKQKLQALAQDPKFKSADDATKLRMAAMVEAESGNVENLTKNLQSAELVETRDIANKQKQLDLHSQEIGKTLSVLKSVPLEKLTETFNNLPQESQKALINEVGPANWERMTPKEKLAATEGLMYNAKGQLATQLKLLELEKAAKLNDSRERIAEINASARIQARMIGGSGDEMKAWNTYELRQQAIERSGAKTIEKLNEKVDNAQAKLDKTRFFSGAETAAYERAVKDRDAFQRKQIQQELNLAVSAPAFPGKETIVDNLKQQLELYPEPDSKSGKSDAAPAAPAKEAPTATPTAESTKTTGAGTATSPLSMPQSADQLVDGSYYQTAKGTLVWDKASSTFIEPKITKEDTTKYTRSKGVRGNWEYTRSTRGMTKAEYAELDKKKKE